MKKLTVMVLCFWLVLLFTGCNSAQSGDYPATIMVDGTLYYSTDNVASVKVDEKDIQYTTSYAEDGVPKKNGETNFDRTTGSPYAVLDDGVVVLIDNKWIAFTAK